MAAAAIAVHLTVVAVKLAVAAEHLEVAYSARVSAVVQELR